MAVEMVDGKFVAKGSGGVEKPERQPKYPYKENQYDSLLRIAQADGLPVGETKAKQTATVNTMTEIIIDNFINSRTDKDKKSDKK